VPDADQLLADAIALAADLFRHERDRAGRPYVLHLLHVMNAVQVDGPDAMTVAVLHDVLEDTPTTAADLLARGFPPTIVDAVEAMTKRAGEPYDDYINRVRQNPLARVVKRADIRHNLDVLRLNRPPTDKELQRVRKYVTAHLALGDTE
jgi:(p)ppGpp synthase/HD superfamily hydrolase